MSNYFNWKHGRRKLEDIHQMVTTDNDDLCLKKHVLDHKLETRLKGKKFSGEHTSSTVTPTKVFKAILTKNVVFSRRN